MCRPPFWRVGGASDEAVRGHHSHRHLRGDSLRSNLRQAGVRGRVGETCGPRCAVSTRARVRLRVSAWRTVWRVQYADGPGRMRVREHLGLKLASTKTLMSVLVIDHVEWPTPD